MIRDLLAVLIGLVTGATMAVAISSVWVVLMIPARVQDALQAGSPKVLAWALSAGLLLAALGNGTDFSLMLPPWCAALLFIPCGMMVGMLAAALGEMLEVTPVLLQRFGIRNVSQPLRWVITISKGLGAVLACLTFTL